MINCLRLKLLKTISHSNSISRSYNFNMRLFNLKNSKNNNNSKFYSNNYRLFYTYEKIQLF